MARPQGSTKARFHQFSTFGWLARKGPSKLPFINFRPLDGLPARVHQSSHLSLISHPLLLDLHRSTLGELFNYEDRGHIIIGTNLMENAYDLNMKVADFERTNMLALPPI